MTDPDPDAFFKATVASCLVWVVIGLGALLVWMLSSLCRFA